MCELKDSIFFRSIFPKLNHGVNAVQVTTATTFLKTCLYWNLKESKGNYSSLFCEKWKPRKPSPWVHSFHTWEQGAEGVAAWGQTHLRRVVSNRINKLWWKFGRLPAKYVFPSALYGIHSIGMNWIIDISIILCRIDYETPPSRLWDHRKRDTNILSETEVREDPDVFFCVRIAAHINPEPLSRQAAF